MTTTGKTTTMDLEKRLLALDREIHSKPGIVKTAQNSLKILEKLSDWIGQVS